MYLDAFHGIRPNNLELMTPSDVNVLGSICGLTAMKTITGHLIVYGGPQAQHVQRDQTEMVNQEPRW